MSLPTSSKRLIKRSPVTAETIEITSTSGEKFTVKYSDKSASDPSDFVGEVWAPEGSDQHQAT